MSLADLYPLRPWTTVRDAREDLVRWERRVAEQGGLAWLKYGPDGLDLFERYDEIRDRLTPRLVET